MIPARASKKPEATRLMSVSPRRRLARLSAVDRQLLLLLVSLGPEAARDRLAGLAPEPRDERLQRVACVGGRRLLPHGVDERAADDWPAGVSANSTTQQCASGRRASASACARWSVIAFGSTTRLLNFAAIHRQEPCAPRR